MRNRFICLTVAALGLVTLAATVPAGAKTVRECNDEYAANKPAIQGSGQKKKDFVTACRAGTETIPGGAAAAPAPVPAAPAPTSTQAAPPAAPMPAPAPTIARQRPTAAPAPSHAGSPSAANQFATEGEAKSKCPSDTVVWVNTKSGVYHFAGTHNYGNTKNGAFMCEADAGAAGDRAPKNEKHP